MTNPTGTCTRDGCTRPHVARGLCRSHYVVAHRKGSVTEYALVRPPAGREADRFFNLVDASAPCWTWKGGINAAGYGRFVRHPKATERLVYAHRWAWQHLVGPIPEGMTLDHLCRNTICVNPDHLELVTSAENTRRQARARFA